MGIIVKMGLNSSRDKGSSSKFKSLKKLFCVGREKEYECPQRPQLTDAQKNIIRENWKVIQKDIASVGVITFTRLFETHPEVQDQFAPFRSLNYEDLQQSAILKAHALRVMGTVEKCVNRLDQQENFDSVMKKLGYRHASYGADRHFIQHVAPQFIYAIKPSLENIWSEDVEEAWTTLFSLMTYCMRSGMDGDFTSNSEEDNR